jgi:hypothetical protein
MAKPTEVMLNQKQKKQVLSRFKQTVNARRIAEELELPRQQVMLFLETQGLRSYSKSSYC